MRPLLSLGLVLLAPLAHADATGELLQAITAHLARTPVVRAEVIQDKTLHVLKKPLHSEGHMLFARDQGLFWEISKPFPAITVITATKLVQIADGQTSVITTAQQPALAGIAQVFFPVLSGDLSALQHHFDLVASGDKAHWQLQLQPRTAPLNQFIAGLTLQGSEDLEHLVITDHNGDTTDMQFRQVLREPVQLSAEEQARFAP